MKRIRRILFNTLTAISLLLAIATAGLWVRSVFVWNGLTHKRYPSTVPANRAEIRSIWIGRGILMYYEVRPLDEKYRLGLKFDSVPAPAEFTGAKRFIPYPLLISGDYDPAVRRWTVISIPLWVFVIGFTFLPSARIALLYIGRKRARLGHCPACGYDTRANPAKCSECGHEMPVTTKVERT